MELNLKVFSTDGKKNMELISGKMEVNIKDNFIMDYFMEKVYIIGPIINRIMEIGLMV